MMDPIRHPDIDETVAWRTWGQVLEDNPGMLSGILSLLPEAETTEEGNRRVLALYAWLAIAQYEGIALASAEYAHPLENLSTEHDAIPTHPNQAIAPIALRISGKNRHIDPPSHLSLPPSWQVVPVPEIDHEQAGQWPTLSRENASALVDLHELDGWMEAIHHCEILWLTAHPETVVARLTAIGELFEHPDGNLHLPSVTWEGMDRLIKLPLQQRSTPAGQIDAIGRKLPEEAPDHEATRLREALAPPEILNDAMFAKACIQVSYHPPSQGKLARLAGKKIAQDTTDAKASGSPARL